MFSNTSNLRRCASYEDAVRIFKLLPFKTPSRGGARIWYDCMRPLGSKQQHHYRVERLPDESYGVFLYRTMMARFYKPQPNGDRLVVYRWDRRNTSVSFMGDVCHVSGSTRYRTTDGKEVLVPLENGSAELWFDAEGKLDVAKSDHAPTITYRTSAEDKARRAAFKQRMLPYVQLLALRHADVAYPWQDGWREKRNYGPFTKPHIAISDTVIVQHYLEEGITPSDTAVEVLSYIAAGIIRYAKGKARYENKPAPTLAQLESSIMRWMMKTGGCDRKSALVELPKFPVVE